MSLRTPRPEPDPRWETSLAEAPGASPTTSIRPLTASQVPTDPLGPGAPQPAKRERGATSLLPALRDARPVGSEPGGPPELIDEDPQATGARRYRLTSHLGSGGVGHVYLADQVALRREVAVKVVRGELAQQRFLDQFRAEARCAAFLEHPNIVTIYDAGRNYLVMKRVAGRTLEDLVRENPPPPLTRLVEVLLKVCDALMFAHSRGVIHRDLKPDNIMVGDFGEVLLMDWGLALSTGPAADGVQRAPRPHEVANLCAGTPGYMAPEMARADLSRFGPATDVFLLGATLYQCLSGMIPFRGADARTALRASAANRYQPLRELLADPPEALVALQERAMQSDPALRGTVADIAEGLHEWLLSARSDAEARRAYLEGRRLLKVASAAAEVHEAYRGYSSAVTAFDLAATLCPQRAEYAAARRDASQAFVLAAKAAGEPALAQLVASSEARGEGLRASGTFRRPRSGRTPTPGAAEMVELERLREQVGWLEGENRRLEAAAHRAQGTADGEQNRTAEAIGQQQRWKRIALVGAVLAAAAFGALVVALILR